MIRSLPLSVLTRTLNAWASGKPAPFASRLPLDFSAIREAWLIQSHTRVRRLTQSPPETKSNQSARPQSARPRTQSAQKEPSKVRLASNQVPGATVRPALIDRCADPRQLR